MMCPLFKTVFRCVRKLHICKLNGTYVNFLANSVKECKIQNGTMKSWTLILMMISLAVAFIASPSVMAAADNSTNTASSSSPSSGNQTSGTTNGTAATNPSNSTGQPSSKNTSPAASGASGYSSHSGGNGNGTEHIMPNGVKYFDNGTIIAKMNGKDSKFFLKTDVHFYPYGNVKNPGSPDPVVPCPHSSKAMSAYQYTISRTGCGLMEFDPLNNETMTQQQLRASSGYWTYDGDAPAENATYAFYRDTMGFHVGVQAPANGTYAGYFGQTANSSASLFHSVITSPVRTIPSNNNYFQNGMYIQTAHANINYVTCVSITNNVGTVWAIIHTYGTANSAAKFYVLWIDNSQNQPLTRDCTIITNGNNYLKVYLDGQVVYASSTLNLQMPYPLNTYLEPQSSYAGQILYGTYNDYYETSGENVTMSSIPPGSNEAEVLNSQGTVVASSQVNGTSTNIDIGAIHTPINGTLVLTSVSNGTIASTPNFYNVFGGDRYSVVGTMYAPQPPTNLTATVSPATQANLSWKAPSNDGGSQVTGYMVERLAGNGTTWSTIAANTNTTSTTYSDKNLTSGAKYTYRVSAINSVGVSAPSNTTYAVAYQQLVIAKSGLVAFDPLNNMTSNKQQLLARPGFWSYDGSATGQNATYDLFEDARGLHIAVKAKTNGTYAGFSAQSPPLGASLYHAVVTVKTRQLNATGLDFQGGLYVEDPSQVNYVTCVAITQGDGTYWSVVQSSGSTSTSTQYTTLYADNSPDQPLTRDCTIVTNGNNFLAVYLDHSKVYTSSSLNLQLNPSASGMQGILDSESSYAHTLLQGIYSDFYATSTQSIAVTHLPSNAATAVLIGPTGSQLATSTVSSGSAHIIVAKYLMPISGTINVYDANNVLLASTGSPVNSFAGDTYTVK